MNKSIQELFTLYCACFNQSLTETPDPVKTAAFFSDCFIGSGPNGIACGKKNDAFNEAMAQGYGFYKAIGITDMVIRGMDETRIDAIHTMVKVFWSSCYAKENKKGEIPFEVIYLLRFDGQWKIFAYITGDEQAEFKRYGLIP